MHTEKGITIVIPAYNAAETLPNILHTLLKVLQDLAMLWGVLIVDDGSTDDTVKVIEPLLLANQSIRLLRHRRNRGYGAALRTGFAHARFPLVATLDADAQHDPRDLPRLLDALEDGVAMVSGLRTGFHHTPLWRQPGKYFIRLLIEFLSDSTIPDFNCGFRVYRKEMAQKYLHLCPDGFSFSTTLLLAFLNRGYEVRFVPITANPRKGNSPSRVSIRTGFATILLVLRLMTLFNPLRVFLPVSFLCSLVGVIWGIPWYLMGHGLSVGALFFLLTGVIIFFMGLLTDQIAELRKERYE